MVNRKLAGRWRKAGIGREIQPNLVPFDTVVLEDESVRNSLQQLMGFFFVLFHAMIAFGPLVRITHQLLHALFILIALLGCERPAIDQQRLGQRTFFGLDNFPVLGPPIILAMKMVSPMSVVSAFPIELILHSFANQLVGIVGKRRLGLR